MKNADVKIISGVFEMCDERDNEQRDLDTMGYIPLPDSPKQECDGMHKTCTQDKNEVPPEANEVSHLNKGS